MSKSDKRLEALRGKIEKRNKAKNKVKTAIQTIKGGNKLELMEDYKKTSEMVIYLKECESQFIHEQAFNPKILIKFDSQKSEKLKFDSDGSIITGEYERPRGLFSMFDYGDNRAEEKPTPEILVSEMFAQKLIEYLINDYQQRLDKIKAALLKVLK